MEIIGEGGYPHPLGGRGAGSDSDLGRQERVQRYITNQ